MTRDDFRPTSLRLAEALERVRQHWRKRRDEVRLSPPPLPPSPPPFTIALSTEAGIEAPAVAHALGERLGWHVYDHELVEQVAREMGVRTELLESLGERQKSWLGELFQALFTGETVSEIACVHHLAHTLLALAAHGECILVGHGAAQILPPATTVRVRLVGPRHERIAALQRRCGWSRDKAEQWLEQTDREQRAFLQEHFRIDPADPGQYDLLLNAFRFSPPQCADLIVTALRRLQGTAAGPPRASSASSAAAHAP
jgi:cytidylate kinase